VEEEEEEEEELKVEVLAQKLSEENEPPYKSWKSF
jgi:hypothetical protein